MISFIQNIFSNIKYNMKKKIISNKMKSNRQPYFNDIEIDIETPPFGLGLKYLLFVFLKYKNI